jgi:hypothetical protein
MAYYTSLDMLKLLTKEQMQRWLLLNQAITDLDNALLMGLAHEVIETSDPGDDQVLGFDVDLTEEMISGETGESLHLKFETTWADEASVQADKRAFFESQHYTEDQILAAL